jgi:hypothetical protein
MGVGPNTSSILPRISVEDLSSRTADDLEEWMRSKQIERSSARAMGALKRREKAAPKPKVPKPRKHKNHCYCVPHGEDEPICCRCTAAKCLKVKKPRATKTKCIASGSPLEAVSTAAVSVE